MRDLEKFLQKLALQMEEKDFALFKAIYEEDLKKVQEAIANGANVSDIASHTWGQTPLSTACEQGNIPIAQELLSYGADVNYRDKFGNNILKECIYPGKIEFFKLFVDAGADINNKSSNNFTLLHVVKDIKVAKFLIERGLDVNAQDESGRTPLAHLIISQSNDIELLNVFLQAGADINIKDNYGNAFIYRAFFNCLSFVTTLLSYDPDIDAIKLIKSLEHRDIPTIFKYGTSYQKLKACVNIFNALSTILDHETYGISAKQAIEHLTTAFQSIDLNELITTSAAKTIGDISKIISDLSSMLQLCQDNKDKYETSDPKLYQALQKLVPGLEESVSKLKGHRTDLILEHVGSETQTSEFKEKLELFMNTYFVLKEGKRLDLFKDFITDYFDEDDDIVNEIPIAQQETKIQHLGDEAGSGGGCS